MKRTQTVILMFAASLLFATGASAGDDAEGTVQLAQAAKDAAKKSTNVWRNPLTASLIVLGSALVVGIIVTSVTDDDGGDPPVSPF